MKSKPAFDWKFRNGQAALVAMVLALFFFFMGYATTSSAHADLSTCRTYLAQSNVMRMFYIKGLIDGYAVALSQLKAYAIREKNDPRPATVISGLATAAAAMEESMGPVGKLTIGAVREMLDTECAKSPNKRVVEAFVNIMVQLN